MKKIFNKNHNLNVILPNITKWAQTTALTLALSFFITAPVMAQAPVPTLDNLHNRGIINPATQEKDDQGNPIEGTGTVYPESAYTLTEIENAAPDNLPQNAITLYDKNEDGTVTPKYYLVNLKDSVTNIGSGDTTKYFEWSQNTDTGNLEFKEVSSPTEGKQTITVNYDSSSLQERINNTEDKSSETITGTFVNKTTGSTSGDQYGGAIRNNGSSAKLGDINADFIGNHVPQLVSGIHGAGAIYNYGTIGDITGDFIGNYVLGGSYANGGAIYNLRGTIGDITGDFIGNYVFSSTSVYGGAIRNNGTIGNITGDFVNNYIFSENSHGMGGAIFMDYGYKIGNITGDFVNNYIKSASSYALGGAMYFYSQSIIGDITGNFIENYVLANTDAHGGAINNNGSMENITGNFIGNYANGKNAIGGAISNGNYEHTNSGTTATIKNINGDFIYNYAYATDGYASGGAIHNERTIGDITGDFIGNYAQGSSEAFGGAIYNYSYDLQRYPATIGSKDEEGNVVGGIINSSFINNHATATGENATALGGAIYTNSSLNIIAQDGGQSIFSGNYTEADGVKTPNAIYVVGIQPSSSMQTTIVSIDTDKIIYQESNFDREDFTTLTLNANTNGVIRFDDQISGSNANLVNNTYQMNIIGMAQNFEGKDEIYGLLGLSDDATVSEVIDAYIAFMQQQYPDEELPENIKEQILRQFIDMGAVETSDPEFISGETKGGYDLKITGDSTGKVILNNDIINANISLDHTNLYLGREDVFNQSQSLTLNSGSIYLNNQSIGTMHIPTLNLNGNTNLSVDVDLANKAMDRITANTYNVKDNAMLNVNNVVLLSDAKEDKTDILFADEELASNVAYTGTSPIAYTPIYKYEVTYNPDDGFFTFARGAASSGNASSAFNPSVLASPVATQAGAYTTQLQTFNYAFQHADTFMNIPYLERVAMINQNKYALSPTGDATDVGTYSPLLLKEESAGFWVKPYASFENVPLKNGPKVSNINYGTLIGYDSPLTSISNGFERVLTGYIGYNGASQRYQGVDAYQNGGILGTTATFYKGNFFNATTLSVGATAGDASTMYGSENYTMLLAGVGNKTGYNFEFFDGKMIFQPSFLISYTFVNTFDYNNAAGVRIESDPMHAIQLSPGLKLIGNTKNGWQPYIGVNMVWNLLDESKVTANDIRLPEMSIKPYVQYGVGIQKRFKDRFLAFGQAMIHNGGRNGISLTTGFRWKVGKE